MRIHPLLQRLPPGQLVSLYDYGTWHSYPSSMALSQLLIVPSRQAPVKNRNSKIRLVENFEGGSLTW